MLPVASRRLPAAGDSDEMKARKIRTLLCLLGATVLGVLTVYFEIIPGVLVPLMFGLAVNFSNDDLMKFKFSEIIIPVAFIAIFLFGTVPFYMLGGFLFGNDFLAAVLGAMGSFLLVCLTLRISLNDVQFKFRQIILLVLLSFAAIYLHAQFTGQSITNYGEGISTGMATRVIIYQSFMILIILSMITDKNGNRKVS